MTLAGATRAFTTVGDMDYQTLRQAVAGHIAESHAGK
jgi:hypothetical protein